MPKKIFREPVSVPEWEPPKWAPLHRKTKVVNRIFVGSCNAQTKDQSFWNTLVSRGADLSILLGDNVYGDCDLHGDCTNLEMAYANLSRTDSFRNFAETMPVLATWDDHDYGLNDAGGDLPWKHVAKAHFLKFFGIPPTDARAQPDHGVHSAFLIGPPDQVLQVILLDVRWYKTKLLDSPYEDIEGYERYIPSFDPNLTMLGEEQWAWLEEELQRPAHIRLIGTSIQLLSMSHGFESWHAAPLQRDRLIRLISHATPRPYVLSGDRHSGAIYQYKRITEMTASSWTNSEWGNPGKYELKDPLRVGSMVSVNNVGVIDLNWEDHTASMYLSPL